MAELPRVGQIFDARYRIEAVLGTGGFGTVFKVCQLDCNRVAMKNKGVLLLLRDIY